MELRCVCRHVLEHRLPDFRGELSKPTTRSLRQTRVENAAYTSRGVKGEEEIAVVDSDGTQK